MPGHRLGAVAGLLPASPELRPCVHTPGTAWPTLGQLVGANTRLIVFNQDGSDPAIPFYHYMWGQLVWDTPFSNTLSAVDELNRISVASQ